MKQDLTVPVELRTSLKKSHLKKLRKSKFVPAIVYGPKQNNYTISLDMRFAEKFSGKEYENKILTLKSKEKDLDGLKVIKKNVTLHILKQLPLHMDFLSLDMKKALRVNVEVKFEGQAKGVKEEGGVFNTILRTVEVECLPSEIPEFISVNVTSLSLNENLHVSDLQIPENIKLVTKPETTLCTVSEVKEEKEETPEEKAALVAKDSPETKPEETKETKEATKTKNETKK